jgi:pSer/pThr/pTyr-binding forkhead associated (FHA) protein
MEENEQNNSHITMILYTIDNDKKTPVQNWDIIPKKKYIIGRSKKEVDLPLNIKLLSRKHAELIYYDSKTIMIKDLNSRNGTFINKLKIETLKETFFTNKDKLSFGNTNNEIIFFDNSEQHKENLPLTDSEKNQESDSDKKGSDEKQNEINIENKKIVKYDNLEEINTDIKQDKKIENENNPINDIRKERESKGRINERLEEREREKERETDYYNKYNKNSKESSKQSELERDKNIPRSISNRDNYPKKKDIINVRDSSYERRSDRYNMPNKSRDSHRLLNKSNSREKPNYSRSRSRSHSCSGSRETLIHQNNYTNQRREEPKEKNKYDKEYYPNDDERDRDRERERRDYYKSREYEERRREDEYRKRRSFEREREKEKDYYDKERRRDYNDNYFEKGDKIFLKPDKFEIVMDQNNQDKLRNKNDKDGDMGYIKCYVEGYMYLKIRKAENKWSK